MTTNKPIEDDTCYMHKENGTYTVPWKCNNCGQEFLVKSTKGHEQAGYHVQCPTCNVRGHSSKTGNALEVT